MIIDAKNIILGRLASFAAKQALLGEKIDIINCNDSIVIGRKKIILEKYRNRVARGTPGKGPFFPKTAERFVKRTIRGMLPYKQFRGREALKSIKCYNDIPQSLKEKETKYLEKFDVYKTNNLNFLKVSDICKYLKGR